ncbi:hypothetical protein [Terrabacter sp. C0L_2]|uniref:hypothetical protein n=1 Tax=Terrabacter sp. C0L_2 TaxID=3108389 RepID=UPI002ED143BF|nr:hypothetical protein U5C87_17595 [Terrabacter sp. C0L_2]
MSTYEPGTVAVATVRGVPNVRVFYRETHGEGDWAYSPDPARGLEYSCDSVHLGVVTDIRPLVVLDLGPGSIPAERAVKLLRTVTYPEAEFPRLRNWLADQIEAQATPPRIPEPGLWGVVEASWDSKHPTTIPRAEWMRTKGNEWRSCISNVAARWDDLVDPVLVRPGVEDEQ